MTFRTIFEATPSQEFLIWFPVLGLAYVLIGVLLVLKPQLYLNWVFAGVWGSCGKSIELDMARFLEHLDGRYLPGSKPVAVCFAKRTLHGRRGSGNEFCAHAVQRSVSRKLCGCRQAIYFLRIHAETNSGRGFDHGRSLRSCDVPGEARQSHRNIAARGR